jgi:hypothetical protein
VKCSRCNLEILGLSYSIARVTNDGMARVCNLCRDCSIQVWGAAGRNRLENVLERAGWSQLTLPGLDPYGRIA